MQPKFNELSPAEIKLLVDKNGTDCCLGWANWPEMELNQTSHLSATISDIAFPFFNNIFHTRFAEENIVSAIETTLEPYRQRSVPLFWWTGPATLPENLHEHLLQHGLVHGFTAAAMAVDIHQTVEVQAAADVTINEVLIQEDLKQWCDVMCPVYEFPEFTWQPWFEMLAHLGLNTLGNYRHFLAYQQGKPVATASVYFSDGVAGISCVATLPEARRQGLGTAVTLTALQAAKEAGYHIGVLFASPMGESIYRKIGFTQVGQGSCYIWSPQA